MRRLHFVGIGGAGMSGIAELMANLGYEVQGSDERETSTTQRLRSLGINVYLGHRGDQVNNVDAVVVSSAVAGENPEVIRARGTRIPVVRRAEMLAELMRFHYGVAVAGTHGKTTTTSLIASVLAEARLDPTFVIGGVLNSAGANARLGSSKYMIAEADESDASFLHLQPMLAVVTNIDADHMQTYDYDFSRLRDTFMAFLRNLPFYGLAVLCVDDVELRNLLTQVPRPVRTYGIQQEADVQGCNVHQRGLVMEFDVVINGSPFAECIQLNLPGRHNVLNALAAICVALEFGIEKAVIGRALARFEGVGRRFVATPCAMADGRRLILVDDYGHHPRELEVTMAAARAGWPGRRLVLVFQPHRYTRTREQFEDFVKVLSDADLLVLCEVYALGEEPLAGADGRSLCWAIRSRGLVAPLFAADLDEVPNILCDVVEDNDVVLVSGAGDIGALAGRLPGLLASLAMTKQRRR
jgi:UDP-N-acetylmuramate--alanine ligase